MPAKHLLLGALVAASLALPACDFGSNEPFVRRTANYTFEFTLAPWLPDGTDLDDPPVEWSIERSDERANESDWSVKLHLENLNDAGKIWIEAAPAPFQNLVPGVTYDVRIAFDFGSSDGEVNAWRIIAGASPRDPETVDHLTFQGSTESETGPDQFSWSRKEFSFTTMPSAEGRLWFAIGVWGTSEFTRDYFIDNLDIEVVRGD
ncbi:MAG: hypothetical protein KY397_01290 [Gemmatimonadetes bacterium]|nr:hypothetical protein [Gemmatimonadota bacterium]